MTAACKRKAATVRSNIRNENTVVRAAKEEKRKPEAPKERR